MRKFAGGGGVHSGYREGVVLKSLAKPYTTFKIISNNYLLKEE